MKSIYIVRHAKSSWADLSMQDVDRPLNKRGKRDAPIMSKLCLDRKLIPNIMISSNATRALETANIFANVFGIKEQHIVVNNKLYHAPEDTYFEEAQLIDDKFSSIMMFGHNPGITYLANSVTNKYIDNVPTCGVLVIESTVDSWINIDPMNCTLVDFLYPKM